jgi:hypothetical protein
MAELTLDASYVEMLIAQTRALNGKVEATDEAAGSNPTDDDGPGLLIETPDDLTREEIVAEIAGMGADEKAELVALMWLGRGDADLDDWDNLLAEAQERAEGPAEDYLLGEPMVADFWAEGLAEFERRAG